MESFSARHVGQEEMTPRLASKTTSQASDAPEGRERLTMICGYCTGEIADENLHNVAPWLWPQRCKAKISLNLRFFRFEEFLAL